MPPSPDLSLPPHPAITNPLHSAPLCSPEDLGKPLPPDEHAVSVCLPTWSSVIAYEEGVPEVLGKFLGGYPRFCSHRYTEQLFAAAEAELANPGENCLVFPRPIHAERCAAFVSKSFPDAPVRTETFGQFGLGVTVVPASLRGEARKFWRYCGEIVSSRLSLAAIGKSTAPFPSEAEADAARLKIRERLGKHSGASPDDVFLFPSGMAAVFAVQRMLTALRPGLPTIQCDFPYVDVLRVQREFGSGVHFLQLNDPNEYDEVARIAQEGCAGIYGELPSNPLLRTVDVPRLRAIADESDTPLVLDDTIGPSLNVGALAAGADVLTTSLTKSFSGRGDVLAGAITLNVKSPHYADFRKFLDHENDNELSAPDAVALEANSHGYVDRVAAFNRNGAALVEVLADHPAVDRVAYPTLETPENYAAIQLPGAGHGPLLSFTLQGGEAAAAQFFDRLQVCKGPSLGTDFTLACPYTLLAHYDELPWAAACGVPRDLIRVSAGTEDCDDLIGRFTKALE